MTSIRFRFRFSLRTILLVVTVFALCLGLQVYRTRQQENAVARIQALGGQVWYEYHYTNERLNENAKSKISKWLWPVIGKGKIKCVAFALPVDDKDLRELPLHLQPLPKFCLLSFDRTNIGDATLQRLKSLRNFEGLNIDGTRVTDSGLLYLKEMPSLSHLSIVFADQLSDAGIAQLAEFPHLRYVSFNSNNPKITQKAWDVVNSINELNNSTR